jgi:hypothetical protein
MILFQPPFDKRTKEREKYSIIAVCEKREAPHTEQRYASLIDRDSSNMCDSECPSLLTLPIELVYRILDHLEEWKILISVRDVCTRLNNITETYHRYQVNNGYRRNAVLDVPRR